MFFPVHIEGSSNLASYGVVSVCILDLFISFEIIHVPDLVADHTVHFVNSSSSAFLSEFVLSHSHFTVCLIDNYTVKLILCKRALIQSAIGCIVETFPRGYTIE